MKLTYFTNIADRAFATNASGQHLFRLHGPFSRPYLLPNSAVKEKLRKKLAWYYNIDFLFCVSVLIMYTETFFRYGSGLLYFLTAMAGLGALQHAVCWLLFRNDLKSLPRAERRTWKECAVDVARRTWKECAVDVARRESVTMLTLMVVASLVFALPGLFGVWIGMTRGFDLRLVVVGISSLLFSGVGAVWFGYAFLLKQRLQDAESADSWETRNPR